MLIFAGILTTILICAAVEATRVANEKATQDNDWIVHNRMVKHAQERARSGVGAWHS
jgi:hypothetical protein